MDTLLKFVCRAGRLTCWAWLMEQHECGPHARRTTSGACAICAWFNMRRTCGYKCNICPANATQHACCSWQSSVHVLGVTLFSEMRERTVYWLRGTELPFTILLEICATRKCTVRFRAGWLPFPTGYCWNIFLWSDPVPQREHFFIFLLHKLFLLCVPIIAIQISGSGLK